MAGPPPPPPPKPQVNSPWKVRKATDPMDEGIVKLCFRAEGRKPMNTMAPPKGTFPGTEQIFNFPPLGTRDGQQLMDRTFREVLMTALASVDGNGGTREKNFVNRTSIREFCQMSAAERLRLIDTVWDAAVDAYPFATDAQAMSVPGAVPASNSDPFPTSWCPAVPGDASTCRRRMHDSGRDMWEKLAVGFRVENELARAMGAGFTQQRGSQDFMIGVRGQRLDGTRVAFGTDQNNARFWTGSHDIWNESAVCVSRNLFGACAFPDRETVGDKILFAVSCVGLRGFDCEAVQRQRRRVWRPGEKAFHSITKDRIIGHVTIRRTGRTGEGYNFAIDPSANWTMTGKGTEAQRQFIRDELDGWRGNHVLDGTFDFA